MRRLVLAIAALAMLALPASSLAHGGNGNHGDNSNHHGRGVSGLDKRFLKQSSQGNWFEVKLGDLAATNASTQAVKDLAAKLAADHAANEQLVVALAGRYGVTLSGKPSATQNVILKHLAAKTGADFDQAWLEVQAGHHEDALDLLHDEQADGRNRKVVRLAFDTEPVVQMHYEMVLAALGQPVPVSDPGDDDGDDNGGGGCHGSGGGDRSAAATA
jgi:putative membrane protein